MKKKKPNSKLSAEEKRMEAEIERGEWTSAVDKDIDRYREQFTDAAKNSSRDARISLRLNSDDVEKIRVAAEREGMPYQTLIGSILHKYATGQLIEEKAIEAVMRKINKKAAG